MKFTSLRKSMICKFSKMSVTHPQSETPTDQRHKSKRPKLRRGPKSRTSAISVLAAGCGCQSRLGFALDQIPADAHMPDVCSVQSLPSSCSSPETNKVEEQCSEWKSIASFDEMLKWSSKSHGQKEVHYNNRSSFDQISYVKFNDLVTKFQLEKQITSETSAEFQHVRQSFASPKVKPQRQTGNISQTTSMNKVIRLADSLLIMKSSSDPRKEFRDSMMEMIAENKIKDGKDLEELLAGYLLLNSAYYHDLIIQVFKQIWVELIQI